MHVVFNRYPRTTVVVSFTVTWALWLPLVGLLLSRIPGGTYGNWRVWVSAGAVFGFSLGFALTRFIDEPH